MKVSYRHVIAMTVAAAYGALAMAQSPPSQQDDEAKVRAERKAVDNARTFEQNARTFTIYDRHGRMLKTVGVRGLYGNPSFSPDGKRIVYTKRDLEKENQDLWIMDLGTGAEVQVTAAKMREFTSPAVWSPDGSQIAYTAVRGGKISIFRHPASGQGAEELVYEVGAIVFPTDWSSDGRALSLTTNSLAANVVSSLPVDGSAESKPTEIYRSDKPLQAGRISPDGRLIAYVSNESGRNEIYVRPFSPTGAAGPWQVSDQGGLGMTSWRKDGKELYFMAADRTLMSVAVTTSPTVSFGKPQPLFKPDDAIAAGPGVVDISRDGELVLIAVPPPQLRQLTIFDRQGKAVRTVGEPTQAVLQPHFSPDGKKLVYMKLDPKISQIEIRTFDLEADKELAVTRNNWPENGPIWSHDGGHVLYASTRDQYSSIYRKNWDGTGEEEMLFRYTPGAGIVLTDASPDGKFLTFYTGVLVLVPLAGNDPLRRQPIDWLRDEYDNVGAKFSPDGRFVAYLTDPDDPRSLDVFVRPFDADNPEAPPGEPVRISNGGVAVGMVAWRRDGKELYFMTRDWEIMAVDVSTTPSFEAGPPKLLFKLPVQPVGNPLQWDNVTRDGQQFIFTMPAS